MLFEMFSLSLFSKTVPDRCILQLSHLPVQVKLIQLPKFVCFFNDRKHSTHYPNTAYKVYAKSIGTLLCVRTGFGIGDRGNCG